MIGRLLAVGVPLLLAVGCASSPDATPPPSDSPIPPVETAQAPAPVVAVQVLDCRDPIASSTRPDTGMVTPLGVIALQSRRLQVREGTDVPGGFVGKTGLQIRVGAEVTIRSIGVPRARFAWGNIGASSFGRVFRVPACRAPAAAPRARWLTYPGLIATDGRGCVTIRVQEGGRHEDMRLGVGASCR